MTTLPPNQSAAANGLSAVRSRVAGNRERAVRSTAAAEAVAELGRSLSQADQDSPQMKTTGQRYASGEVHVVGLRPRPDDHDHRCGTGSALASSAILAARSTSLVQHLGARMLERHAKRSLFITWSRPHGFADSASGMQRERRTRRSTQQPPALAVASFAASSAARFAADVFFRRLWVNVGVCGALPRGVG